MHRFRVRFEGGYELAVTLRARRTKTISFLEASIPFKSLVMRWGDEIYFEVPFHAPLEDDAREVMDVGEVAYWPDGNAVALFFGRTPVSVDDKPRAYTACNIVGNFEVDVSELRKVKSGCVVEVVLEQ
jgi:hypothetical protein